MCGALDSQQEQQQHVRAFVVVLEGATEEREKAEPACWLTPLPRQYTYTYYTRTPWTFFAKLSRSTFNTLAGIFHPGDVPLLSLSLARATERKKEGYRGRERISFYCSRRAGLFFTSICLRNTILDYYGARPRESFAESRESVWVCFASLLAFLAGVFFFVSSFLLLLLLSFLQCEIFLWSEDFCFKERLFLYQILLRYSNLFHRIFSNLKFKKCFFL